VSAIAQTAAGIVVPQRAPEGGGGVFRYDGGTSWTSLGLQPDTTQVYSIETFGGAMHVGTWPNGIVYRLEPDGGWYSCGRLGDETEVMNLLAFNGLLYAGTLPRAQVFRMDGPASWTEVGRLDWTSDVLYRRAASMAIHRGRLVVGTLPSGHVHAMRVGQAVSSGRPVSPGDHHVAGVRRGPTLELYLDGVLVASERDPSGASLDLAELPALQSGTGPRGRFGGHVAGSMIHARAMDPSEIALLARSRPAAMADAEPVPRRPTAGG
jgi:Concanavalin A-like lectin/glucanases superfamily